ncbi:WG repeat-containing protein [Thiorhodococcus minor]|uniref:WG repeat-containing protein n=1 Tax=Thiorhodococcus minor TaxID=57489 RepID=A0A6M0JUT7_9GAMM|nr:WG repeat-containing protein [Thiorhodococcus minor]NEV60353.1 WG repeat-containing protein [Thiorhodococcus minor]
MGQRAPTTLALLFWSAFTGAAGFPLSCAYVAQAADAELVSHPACAALDGERLILAPTHFRQMRFETDGLASVWVAGRWYDVQPSGAALPVVTLDNGPDPFTEGLVRSQRQGRILYVDVHFREIIGPRYDWGWPFVRRRALVCRGCRLIQEGEHSRLSGGRWGWIDRQGREVVPVQLTEAQARSR